MIANYPPWLNHHSLSWSLIYKIGIKLSVLSFLQDFQDELEKCWLKCLKMGNENEKWIVYSAMYESQLCRRGL